MRRRSARSRSGVASDAVGGVGVDRADRRVVDVVRGRRRGLRDAGADAAQHHGRVAPAQRGDGHAGHLRHVVLQPVEAAFGQARGADGGDRGRHVDQRLLALLRRDHDHLAAGRPRRLLRRCRRGSRRRQVQTLPRPGRAPWPACSARAAPAGVAAASAVGRACSGFVATAWRGWCARSGLASRSCLHLFGRVAPARSSAALRSSREIRRVAARRSFRD